MKSYKQAFLDNNNREYTVIQVVGDGDRDKAKKVKMYESSTEIPAPEGPNKEREWQADHVNDLGYWTTIVNADNAKPKDCTGKAWNAVQRVIRGEKNKQVFFTVSLLMSALLMP